MIHTCVATSGDDGLAVCLLWDTILTIQAGLTCPMMRGARGTPHGCSCRTPTSDAICCPRLLLAPELQHMVLIAGLLFLGHTVSHAPHCLFLFNRILSAFHCYEFLTAFCPLRAPLLIFESVYIDMEPILPSSVISRLWLSVYGVCCHPQWNQKSLLKTIHEVFVSDPWKARKLSCFLFNSNSKSTKSCLCLLPTWQPLSLFPHTHTVSSAGQRLKRQLQ